MLDSLPMSDKEKRTSISVHSEIITHILSFSNATNRPLMLPTSMTSTSQSNHQTAISDRIAIAKHYFESQGLPSVHKKASVQVGSSGVEKKHQHHGAVSKPHKLQIAAPTVLLIESKGSGKQDEVFKGGTDNLPLMLPTSMTSTSQSKHQTEIRDRISMAKHYFESQGLPSAHKKASVLHVQVGSSGVEKSTHQHHGTVSTPHKLQIAAPTVLLIGSTGNGKSTLGNFLLDPRIERDKKFKVAKANKPETQNTQSASAILSGTFEKYSKVNLTVIDTPGLNEDAVKDLQHMIGMVETLHKVKQVTACILVIKFNSKIDAQYKQTICYYSKLLRSLFEKNVFVVMTDYQTDKRTVALRKREGIDVDQIKANTAKELVACAKLSYDDPLVFAMDCLPVDDDDLLHSISLNH